MNTNRGVLGWLILVVGIIGLIGSDFITPAHCGEAKDQKALKGGGAVKKTSAAKKANLPSPVVTVATPVTILSKKLSIGIMGAGYVPGQEIRILFTDEDGMQTDIGETLEPAPLVNKSGAWNTTWMADDFVKAKIVKAGVFTLTVANEELEPLARTAIAFKEAPAPTKPAGDKSGDKSGDKAGDKAQKKSEGK